mgnify:FL=1
MMLNFLDVMIILYISVHWGFATGAFIAVRTDWNIPRFILICLLTRYFIMSYGY